MSNHSFMYPLIIFETPGEEQEKHMVVLMFGWGGHKKEHGWFLMATMLFILVLILPSIKSIRLYIRPVMHTCLK